MHLGRATAKKLRVAEVRSDELGGQIGNGAVDSIENLVCRGLFLNRLGRSLIADQMLEEAADGVERIAPGIAAVLRVALQDGQRQLLLPFALILEPACELGSEFERSLFAQESGHLEIGVHARLEPAEKLEKELAAIDDRGVALLGA